MNYKELIGRILGEISEITQFLQNDKEAVKKITPDLIRDMKKLKEWMAFFKNVNDRGFREANIDIKQLQLESTRSSSISEEDKKIILQTKEIERDLKKAKLIASETKEKVKKTEKERKEQKNRASKRLKTFKTLGNDSKWIPL